MLVLLSITKLTYSAASSSSGPESLEEGGTGGFALAPPKAIILDKIPEKLTVPVKIKHRGLFYFEVGHNATVGDVKQVLHIPDDADFKIFGVTKPADDVLIGQVFSFMSNKPLLGTSHDQLLAFEGPIRQRLEQLNDQDLLRLSLFNTDLMPSFLPLMNSSGEVMFYPTIFNVITFRSYQFKIALAGTLLLVNGVVVKKSDSGSLTDYVPPIRVPLVKDTFPELVTELRPGMPLSVLSMLNAEVMRFVWRTHIQGSPFSCCRAYITEVSQTESVKSLTLTV